MIYRGMDQAALDAAYNIGAAVGIDRRDRYLADWTARTRAFAAQVGARRDLRYGVGERHRVDLYPSSAAKAATLVFIHGGYWQATDKENYGCLAAGPLAHGIDVALVEYTLAPAATIDAIVAEMRQALAFLRENARAPFLLSGHSAGGHLAAMLLDEPDVAGALPISGLFDLEPIRLSYLNGRLGLDAAAAQRLSPLHRIPAAAPPLAIAVGGSELSELRRQSADYHAALVARGIAAELLMLDGHDHFSILEELAAPEGRLTAAARRLLR